MLCAAVQKGDTTQVKRLIASKANINERDERKRTPLHICASAGNESIFHLLNSRKKLDLNAQDERGWTALHYAASKAFYSFCQLLLSCKNLKPQVCNEDKNSAFLYMCMLSLDTSEGSDSVLQYYRTMNLFLSRGADPNERNKYGENGLHWAAKIGNIEAIDFLCRNNCDPNAITRNQETPLYFAVKGRKPEVVRKLLENEALTNHGCHTVESLEQLAGTLAIKNLITNYNAVEIVITEKSKELHNVAEQVNELQAEIDELEKQLRRRKGKQILSTITQQQVQQAQTSTQQTSTPPTTRHIINTITGITTSTNTTTTTTTTTTIIVKPPAKLQKSLVQNLKVHDRLNAQFYIARANYWTCCAKKIECGTLIAASQIMNKMHFISELSHVNILPVVSVSKHETQVITFVSWPSRTLSDLLKQLRIANTSNTTTTTNTNMISNASIDSPTSTHHIKHKSNRSLSLQLPLIQPIAPTIETGVTFLEPEQIVQYLLDIALPLQYLHEQKIVNRCIKSENIYYYMREKGDVDRLMIATFYASKQDNFWIVPNQSSEYNEPAYTLASEARADPSVFRAESDVWAFGIVLYEILTLSKPYSHISSSAQLIEVMKTTSPILPGEFTVCIDYSFEERHDDDSSSSHSTVGASVGVNNDEGVENENSYRKYQNLVDLFLACTSTDPSLRPSMSEVVQSLSSGINIKEVIQNVTHHQPHHLSHPLATSDVDASIQVKFNEWNSKHISYQILPVTQDSPLIKPYPGYSIEAPVNANHLLLSNSSSLLNHKALSSSSQVYIQFTENSIAYYRLFMANEAHENYQGELSGENEQNSLVILSIESESTLCDPQTNLYYYRVIVRNENEDVRFFVACENVKDRLKVLKQHPSVAPYKLQLLKEPTVVHNLLEFEKSQLEPKQYKFGVIYRKSGQLSDDEMFSNIDGSQDYQTFLNFLGDAIPLLNWKKFRGGLDTAHGSTGVQTVFTEMNDFEILFHVATMLPYDPDNPQQLHRKRHIGNDIVVVIFQDMDADRFSPEKWASNFNHVFVIVQPEYAPVTPRGVVGPSSNSTSTLSLDLEPFYCYSAPVQYKISIMYKNTVSLHPRPFLQQTYTYEANEEFRKFFLTKLINCERVALRSASFAKRLLRVRKELLQNIRECVSTSFTLFVTVFANQ